MIINGGYRKRNGGVFAKSLKYRLYSLFAIT